MSIKFGNQRSGLGCFIHTAVIDNIPSLTNEQSWANFNRWYRSRSPPYLPNQKRFALTFQLLLGQYALSPSPTCAWIWKSEWESSLIATRPEMMLPRHPFAIVDLHMIQTFLNLKLLEETPTKLLKLSNNMEVVYRVLPTVPLEQACGAETGASASLLWVQRRHCSFSSVENCLLYWRAASIPASPRTALTSAFPCVAPQADA